MTSELSTRARIILRHIATTRPPPEIYDLARFSRADAEFAAAKTEARANVAAIEELIRESLATLWVEDTWSEIDAGPVTEITDELIDALNADEETKEALRVARDSGIVSGVEVLSDEEAFARAQPRIVISETDRGRELLDQ